MDLKELFGSELWDKIQAKVTAHNTTDKDHKVKLVDLSEGGYVSREKYADKTAALQSQLDDLRAQVGKRDADLADLQAKLKAAGPEKLSEVTQSLTDLQTRYNEESKEWASKLERQAYEFRVKEKAGELSFSSGAAKRDFIRQAIDKGFKLDGENLLGYGDFLAEYQKTDPGAFAAAEPAEPVKKPKAAQPVNPGQNGSRMSLADMMSKANEDPGFVPSFE